MASHDQGAAHGVTADPEIELDKVPWLHELVHCPLNQVPCVSVAVYAQDSQLAEMVGIPGSEPNATAVRALPDTLRVLRHWYQCVWRMHQSGLSLRGEFGAANALVYSTLAVRLAGVHFSRFSKSDADKDYTQFAASVEEMFTLNQSLPDDIKTWLELIREGVNGLEYVIQHNTALMEPRQAFSWLMASRGMLEKLRYTERSAFDAFIWMHAELIDWDLDSHCVNMLMRSAREHIDQHSGRPTYFEPNVMGVLKLTRNCSQHPARHLEHLMVLIMEDDFPGFVARFQLNLFRAPLEISMG